MHVDVNTAHESSFSKLFCLVIPGYGLYDHIVILDCFIIFQSFQLDDICMVMNLSGELHTERSLLKSKNKNNAFFLVLQNMQT